MKAELIRLRREAGLTQKEVAERIGISQQAINKLERYDSDPKLSTMRRYANAVGALVQHHVVQDVGQSEWVASASQWESVTELPSTRLRLAYVNVGRNSAGWTDSKRADFDLAV
jgi:DNA-binding XRE family transcriptional regulator